MCALKVFLGASANCIKRLLASACLSVRLSFPRGTSLLPLTDCHTIWYWKIFRKYDMKIQLSLKSHKINGYCTWRPINVYDQISFIFIYLELEIFWIKFLEKIKTHILCTVTVFRKSCRLWDNVDKYWEAGLATDNNMEHGYYMLDT